MIFIWLLLANLFYTGFRDALHVLDRFDAPLGEAIGNLTLFIIMGLVACIPGIIESVRLYHKKKLQKEQNQQRAWLIMKTWIQLVCISLCYFIGDNLYQTLSVHGEPIGCGDRCLTTSRIASLACLGIAAVSVYLTPSLFKKIESAAKFEKEKEEKSKRNIDLLLYKLLKLFVEGVKVDIMYTTLLGFGMSYGFDFDTKKMQYCENGSKAYGLLIIVSCYLIAIVIAFIAYHSTLIKRRACNHEESDAKDDATATDKNNYSSICRCSDSAAATDKKKDFVICTCSDSAAATDKKKDFVICTCSDSAAATDNMKDFGICRCSDSATATDKKKDSVIYTCSDSATAINEKKYSGIYTCSDSPTAIKKKKDSGTCTCSDNPTAIKKKKVSDICTCDRMLAICCCIFFLFFLVMFTLADNPLPLEYELCNYNSSSPEYRLTKQGIFQVKSVLSFICFLLVLVPVFALFCINFINSLFEALIKPCSLIFPCLKYNV